jgi:heavy metal translocating P-type ATPase
MQKLTSFFRNYPDFASTLFVLLWVIGFIFADQTDLGYGLIVGFSGVIGLKMLIGMVKELREGTYGVDILAIAAIAATIAVGEYWATLVIVLMMTGGEALEDFAGRRAKAELTALLERAPTSTHRKTSSGALEDIPIDEVQEDDELVVKPGEIIPVDAVILEGTSSIDESSLTGESLPVEKNPGEELLSGSVNGESVLTVRALRTAENSQYAQIVELVKAAGSTQAPFVRLADRYAVPFTIISFAIAGFAWYLSSDAVRFAEVLVVATPCPLLLAAPIAMISGMSRAAKHGIIIKSGAILEKLARVKTAAFDKTGTLTQGLLSVQSIHPAEGVSETELLALAASAELVSAHILAETLVNEAKNRNIPLLDTDESREITAQGVTTTIDGEPILVGKLSFLKEMGVVVPKETKLHTDTAVYAARSGEFIGSITLADTVRENSKSTLEKLRSLGVQHSLMLTGDNRQTAEKIATALGISDIRAECLPKDKVEAVTSFPHQPVMMTGDGVNDAPVLAASDVGVAMGARGATAASESADVVILLDDISRVARAVEVAQHTIHIATQSIVIGIIISIVLMIIAATGAIPAVVGAGLQEIVDVIVIINALRAHGSWQKLSSLQAKTRIQSAV